MDDTVKKNKRARRCIKIICSMSTCMCWDCRCMERHLE